MGVTIRHWFNTRHARKGNPHWTWAVTALIFLVIAWLSTAPMRTVPEAEARLEGAALAYAAAPGFEEVVSIVQGRCSMCHAAEPCGRGCIGRPRAWCWRRRRRSPMRRGGSRCSRAIRTPCRRGT